MRLIPPVLLACLALAAPASASVDPVLVDEPLYCLFSGDGEIAIAGYLTLEADGEYRFNRSFPASKPSGVWDGAGAFTSGPLSGSTIADAPAGTTMPADQQEGRTWPLLLAIDDEVSWYCRPSAVNPADVLAPFETYVERVSGVPLALPRRLVPTSLYTDLDGNPYTTVAGRMRAAGSNFWRLDVIAGPCSGKNCTNLAILSARRAPRRELEVRFNRKLARGARGWQGNVGCSFGSGIGWGPVYCGQTVLVFRYRGVNYCIEARTIDAAGFVDVANQMIRSLPKADIA
jgi:hypothetical protein